MGSATGWPREARAEASGHARLPRLPQGEARALRVLRGVGGTAVNPDESHFWLRMALAGAWMVAAESDAPVYACVGVVVDDASGIPDEAIGPNCYGSKGLSWHEAIKTLADRRPDLLPLVREMPRGNRSLCIVAAKGEVFAATMDHAFEMEPKCAEDDDA